MRTLQTRNIGAIFNCPNNTVVPICSTLCSNNIRRLLYQRRRNTTVTTVNCTHTANGANIYVTASNPNTAGLVAKLTSTLLSSVPIITVANRMSTPFVNASTFRRISVLKLSLTYAGRDFLIRSLRRLPHVVTRTFSITDSNHPNPILISVPGSVRLTDNSLRP